MEAEQRRRAADLELVERAQHPHPGVLAVDAVDDQLGDHRVVETADLGAGHDARVDADTGAGRLAVGRDPAGRGQEAARHVLGVDPALDRVPAQEHVLLPDRERLAGRDQHLLADEVDARHLLGDRVLDLDPRVHLHEVVGAVRGQQPFDRARRAVRRRPGPRRRRSARSARAARRRPRARASPRSASGAGAGSCSHARRDGSRSRGCRRAPAPRRDADPRGSARRRRGRRRSTSRPRAAPTRTRARPRPARRRASSPCRRLPPQPSRSAGSRPLRRAGAPRRPSRPARSHQG